MKKIFPPCVSFFCIQNFVHGLIYQFFFKQVTQKIISSIVYVWGGEICTPVKLMLISSGYLLFTVNYKRLFWQTRSLRCEYHLWIEECRREENKNTRRDWEKTERKIFWNLKYLGKIGFVSGQYCKNANTFVVLILFCYWS